jgi:hypothetical protein
VRQPPAGRLDDGTPYFAPLGELPLDEDEQQVQCHLCGEWFRALAPHLRLRHEWDAADYRLAFGLRATRPLQAPERSEQQAARWRTLMREDRRVREGMQKGLALARAGELNEMGRQRDQQLGRALERQRTDRRTGQQLGRRRAKRLRAQRERRARELGFADLETLLRDRYERDGVGVVELAEQLGCAEITVVGDMERLDIARRPQDERLAMGRLALAEQRAASRAAAEARARELGLSCLRDYLVDRHHRRRWRQTDIGRELGVTAAGAVRKLLDAEGVVRLRMSVPAGADMASYRVERLAAAREALAERRRELEEEVATRLGVTGLDEWYACGLATGMTHVALARAAGVSEKWLRVVRRRVVVGRIEPAGDPGDRRVPTARAHGGAAPST